MRDILTIKKILISGIALLIAAELFSGTFGGIRVVTYNQSVSLEDYVENACFDVLQHGTVEVTVEMNKYGSVWTIGHRGTFPGYYTKETMLKEIEQEIRNIDSGNGVQITEKEVDYTKIHLKRMEVWLPYIGAWRSKIILDKLETMGVVEKIEWYPFLTALIPR